MSNEVILRKITLVFLLVFLLSSSTLFSKNTVDDRNVLSAVSVTGNSEEFQNPSKSPEATDENSTAKAVIIITDGAEVYNAENFSNAKIIKIVKAKKKYVLVKKKKINNAHVPKIEIKISKTSVQSTYYNSTENPVAFSQNSTSKIAFSTSSRAEFCKAIISSSQTSGNTYRSRCNQKTIYFNPIILSYHFSGKYSIRPPTYKS